MASYDSDSSLEEAGDYQTTNVLLGYASKEPTDDIISILGGDPAWLDPSTPPSAALARCKTCRDLMPQLLQLHADLPKHFPSHERRLHIFACRRRTCARKPGSVRALRSVRQAYADEVKPGAAAPPPPVKEPSPPRDLGGAIFGGGKLFGGGGNSSSSSGPATQTSDLSSTFASKARISAESPATSIVKKPALDTPPEAWPDERPKAYPRYYLDAEYEELDAAPVADASTSAAMSGVEVETGADASGPSKGEDADAFESILDRTFQRFADRLAQNAEQVLRYEFGGTALLAASNDAVGQALSTNAHPAQTGSSGASQPRRGIPSCTRCGGQRTFEVQLVPGAIDALEAQDDLGVEGMEWSTVIVGVCANDCAGEIGQCVHIDEWAGVQWEEIRKPGE